MFETIVGVGFLALTGLISICAFVNMIDVFSCVETFDDREGQRR